MLMSVENSLYIKQHIPDQSEIISGGEVQQKGLILQIVQRTLPQL